MGGCAIAFMGGKAIAWKPFFQLPHLPVACDLGDDGGCGDGKALAVTADDRLYTDGEWRSPVAVDERQRGPSGQGGDSALHGEICGLENVEGVDFLRGSFTDANLRCGKDGVVERFPLRLCEFLGVIEARWNVARVENHRRRHNGACPWPTSRFINAADHMPIGNGARLVFEIWQGHAVLCPHSPRAVKRVCWVQRWPLRAIRATPFALPSAGAV